MPSAIITRDMFIRMWAHASCMADMEQMTGLSKLWIRKRARKLRKEGVDLPRFGSPKPFDVARLHTVFEEELREKTGGGQ